MRKHQHEHSYHQSHSRPNMEVLSTIYCTAEVWTSKDSQKVQESTRTNQPEEGKGVSSATDGKQIQEGSKDEKGGKSRQKEKEIRLSVKDGC